MSVFAKLSAELQRQFEDQVSRFMASDGGQKMIAWHDQLGERDRLVLRVLGVFLLAVLLVVMVARPALDFADRAQGRLKEERELLAWLQGNASAAHAAAPATAERTGSMVTLVTDTARENDVQVRRFEPDGDNGVRVWLEGAQFNAVVKWLYQLEETHAIRAAEINIERESQPGMVSARLTLRG